MTRCFQKCHFQSVSNFVVRMTSRAFGGGGGGGLFGPGWVLGAQSIEPFRANTSPKSRLHATSPPHPSPSPFHSPPAADSPTITCGRGRGAQPIPTAWGRPRQPPSKSSGHRWGWWRQRCGGSGSPHLGSAAGRRPSPTGVAPPISTRNGGGSACVFWGGARESEEDGVLWVPPAQGNVQHGPLGG